MLAEAVVFLSVMKQKNGMAFNYRYFETGLTVSI
jgi:hypothetical protein